jgi:hypothetical protein
MPETYTGMALDPGFEASPESDAEFGWREKRCRLEKSTECRIYPEEDITGLWLAHEQPNMGAAIWSRQ